MRQKKRLSTFTLGLGKERGYFVENLSMLVSNNMPIIDALNAISQELRLRRMKNIVASVKSDIETGSHLWQALEKTHLFPEYAISLIRLGEASGKFTDNLKIVALEQEKDRLFKSKLRSAMMYPIFVFSLTLIIGIGISWFILPKLAMVFDQLNVELPLFTKLLIGLGKFLNSYGIYAVPVFVIIVATALFLIFFYSKTKFIGQHILFFTPGIKQVLKEVELSRFGYLLGTLLEAGLPINQAFESLASATQIMQYRKLYQHIQGSVVLGNSLQKSFSTYKKINTLVSSPIQQLISIGERSGSLATTLLKIGQTYEVKSDTTTKNLSIILEPILLVMVWLGVVAVAMAVILPIYSLIGSFKAN